MIKLYHILSFHLGEGKITLVHFILPENKWLWICKAKEATPAQNPTLVFTLSHTLVLKAQKNKLKDILIVFLSVPVLCCSVLPTLLVFKQKNNPTL